MRTFVRLRQILATHKDIAEKLQAMERKYDKWFKVVFEISHRLMEFQPAPFPGLAARQLSNLTINCSSGSFPHW
jgi:hypothetical protein